MSETLDEVLAGALLGQVDEYAADARITRAEAIRQLIGDGLDTSRVRAGELSTAQEIAADVRTHGAKIPGELRRRIIEAGETGLLELQVVNARSLRFNAGADARLDLIQRTVSIPAVEGVCNSEQVEIYEVAYKAIFGDTYTMWRKLYTDRASAEQRFDETANANMPRHPFHGPGRADA